MQQLYYTSCPDDRGFSGQRGFGVLAASCDSEREIDRDVLQAAIYPTKALEGMSTPPVRWVWQRQSDGTSMLARCEYVGAHQGGRGGNYFTHIVYQIPSRYGLRDVVVGLNSNFWQNSYCGPPRLASIDVFPAGDVSPGEPGSSGVEHPRIMEVALALCMDLGNSAAGVSWQRLILPAKNDSVMQLIRFLSRALPEKLSSRLTFSTLEQRDALPVTIVGLPDSYVNEAGETSETANLMAADVIWDKLSALAREYASWSMNDVINNKGTELQTLVESADRLSINSVVKLYALWRLFSTPESLKRDEVIHLLDDDPLAEEFLQRPKALQFALQMGMGTPLDSKLLQQLHRHGKRRSPNSASEVEARLSAEIVTTAAKYDFERCRLLIRELKLCPDAARSSTNPSTGSSFCQHFQRILRELNAHHLKRQFTPSHSIDIQCLLLENGLPCFRNADFWKSGEWLSTSDSDECLKIVAIVQANCEPDWANGLAITTVSRFLNTLQASVSQSPLFDWLVQCGPNTLIEILLRVDASREPYLEPLWLNKTFQPTKFFDAAYLRGHHGTSGRNTLFDTVYFKYLSIFIRTTIRSGNVAFLREIRTHYDFDVVRVAINELIDELTNWQVNTSKDVLCGIDTIANDCNPKYLLGVVAEFNAIWPTLSPSAAAWLLNRFDAQGVDEAQLRTVIRSLADSVLRKLQELHQSHLKRLMLLELLTRRLLPEHINEALYLELLHIIGDTGTSGSCSGSQQCEEIEVAISSLLAMSTPEHLTSSEIVSELLRRAEQHARFSEFLQESLRMVPESRILESQSYVNSIWAHAQKFLEDQQVSVPEEYLGKLLSIELVQSLKLKTPQLLFPLEFDSHSSTSLQGRLQLRRFLFAAGTGSLATIHDVADLLSAEEEMYRRRFAILLTLQQFHGLENLVALLSRVKIGVSFFAAAFSDLFRIGEVKNDGYFKLLDLIADRMKPQFEDRRMVSSALFPLVRHAATRTEFALRVSMRLIDIWATRHRITNPNQIVFLLHECSLDLSDADRLEFKRLLAIAMRSTQGGIITQALSSIWNLFS